MISFNQHKVQVLTKVFADIKEKGGMNPKLFITDVDYKNVILPIPSDLMQIDALHQKTDEALRYINKQARALHVSFVSEVNKVAIKEDDLTAEEVEQLKSKRISRELKDKVDSHRVDGLIVHSFSKATGDVEKDFMVFEKKNGTFVPDKNANDAMKSYEPVSYTHLTLPTKRIV